MKRLCLALLIPLSIFAQHGTFTGVNGLGHSSITCIDRDGDGYGVGPAVVVNTTLASSASSGATSVSVTSATGITAGAVMRLDTVQNMEWVQVSSSYTSGTTIPLRVALSLSHASGVLFSDQNCLGRDADDNDPLVWTATQATSKYSNGITGTSNSLFWKIGNDLALENPIPADTASAAGIQAGYTNPHAIWYLAPATASPAGSDSNACNSASVPCLTFARLSTQGYTTSDMVILRDGWNGTCSPVNGTSSKYAVIIAYPGEKPQLSGSNNCSMVGNQVTAFNYIVIDGLALASSSAISGGTADVGLVGNSGFHNILLRNIEGAGGTGAGTGIGWISVFNGLSYFTIEYSNLHGNDCTGGGCQHGIYNGSRMLVSSNVIYQHNLAWGNDTNGLTFNGQCFPGCAITGNISYSNGVSGITVEEGFKNGTISDNLSFSNATDGIVIFNYPGNCATQGGSSGNAQICPFDQTGNLIENNTIYQTANANVVNGNSSVQSCPSGFSYCGQGGITVNNTTSPLAGNLGSNTFRNNIITSYGYQNHYPPVVYGDPTNSGTCDSTCLAYMSSSTWDHNVFFQNDGHAGTGTISFGPGSGFGFAPQTCTSAATYTTMTNCTNADPKFAYYGLTLWNNEGQFDFRIPSVSPAYETGSTTSIPSYDLMGRAFLDDSPDIGALQHNRFSHGWNDMGVATQVTNPAAGAPSFTNNLNFGQTIGGTCTSGNQSGCYPFNTVGNNAFKTWADCILREKPGQSHMLVCADNGGHSDYIGNEINSFTFNAASPAWTRLGGPSTFIGEPGTGATFSSTVSAGALTGCAVTNGGSGYTLGSGGIIWVPQSGDTITSPAQAVYYTAGGVVTSCAVKSNSGGTGYTHAPVGVTGSFTTPLLAAGNVWGVPSLSGAGAPSNPCATANTFYIDATNKNYYNCPSNGGTWTGPTALNIAPVPELSDGSPSARHVTGLQSYSPVEDRMVQFNGGLAGGNGPHFQDMWAYGFSQASTPGWQRLDPTSCGGGCSTSVGSPIRWETQLFAGFSGASVYNPLNDTHFWYFDDGGGFMTLYQPSNSEMIYSGAGGIDVNGAASANGFGRDIIPDRQLAFFVGSNGTGSPDYQASKVDLTKIPTPGGSSSETVITSSISVSGGTSCAAWWKNFVSSQYYSPGLQWDQGIGQFVAMNADGSGTIYTMDPDALTCATYTQTGGPGTTDAVWMFGRFRYSQGADVFPVFQGFNTGGSTSQDLFVFSMNAPDPTTSATPGGGSSVGGSAITGNVKASGHAQVH